MNVKVYYTNSSNVVTLMCRYKTDLLPSNRIFQVEDIDSTGAIAANYTGLIGVVVKKLTYSFQDMINIVKAAHTQAFASATNQGFKLTTKSELNGVTVLLNTKTT